MIQIILESYDEQLRKARNKKELRCKGNRQTTIKTIMGEVEYSRNVYQTLDESGHKAWIYLIAICQCLKQYRQMQGRRLEKLFMDEHRQDKCAYS